MKKRWQGKKLEILCMSLLAFMLAFIASGCGGNTKAELEKSTVSSTMLPMNGEAQIVATMINEAYRREIVASLYAQAVLTYDADKGTPAEYDGLLKKTADAYNRAYETSQVALYLAGNLMNAAKEPGYATFVLPGKQEKKLSLDTAIFSKAYAAYPYDTKSYTDAERMANEIMSAGNGKELTDRWAKLPPEERMERIAKYLHKDKKTARDVWQKIYNDKHGVLTGANATANTIKEVASDVAYRTSAVAKTVGKVAKTALTTKMVAATGGGGGMGGLNVLVKTADVVADAVNTTYIVFTGDEDEFWGNAVACTEAADTVTSIFAGGPSTDFEKAQALTKGKILKLGEEGMARLMKYINAMDTTEKVNTILTVSRKADEAANQGVKILRLEKKKKDDGSTEIKATAVDADDPKLEEKLEDLGIDKEKVKEIKETAEKVTKEEAAAPASEDYAEAAENAEKQGFDTKEAADAAARDLDEANKEVKREAKEELKRESAKSTGTPRAFPYTEAQTPEEEDSALDEALDDRSDAAEAAADQERTEEENKTEPEVKDETATASGTESGKEDTGKDSGKEDTGKDSGAESGNADVEEPPFATSKVVGTYHATWTIDGAVGDGTFVVTGSDGSITITSTVTGSAGSESRTFTNSSSGSLDEQTGSTSIEGISFIGEGGSIALAMSTGIVAYR